MWTSGRKPTSEVQEITYSEEGCIGKSGRPWWVCGYFSSADLLEGCLTCPSGESPMMWGIHGIVLRNTHSASCLLIFVELFSILLLDLRNRASPSDPWRKPPFLDSAPGCHSPLWGKCWQRQLCKAHFNPYGWARWWEATFPITSLQVDSQPLPLTAGSVSTRHCSINKLKQCFLLEEVLN